MKKENVIKIAYVAVFLVISLIPLLFFNSKQPLIGNETRAVKPLLINEAGINTSFFPEADAYVAQNFGFRNDLVYAGNAFKSILFKTSGQSSVIIGEDGWLFYESALKDYVGSDRLSDVQIEKLKVILELTAEYVEAQGKDFIFVSAPNKLSVYGEYMPYYYLRTEELTNYERLMLALRDSSVCYVDLCNELQAAKLSGIRLYHKKDSHWNNYGAAVAYEAIMNKLILSYGDYEYTAYTDKSHDIKNNFSGDLQSMLFPGSDYKDEQVYFDVAETYEYTSRYKSEEDLLISTANSSALVDKRATLYRDSFGNALYGFFANDFAGLNAKREIPYNIYSAIADTDVIVIELVERNLGNLLEYVPIIPAAADETFLTDNQINEVVEGKSVQGYLSFYEEGLYCLSGSCTELENTAEIYLLTGAVAYQLMPSGEGCDFTGYFETDEAELFTQEGENPAIVYEKNGVYVKIPLIVTLQD